MSYIKDELLTIEETSINRYNLPLKGSYLDLSTQLMSEYEQMQEDEHFEKFLDSVEKAPF